MDTWRPGPSIARGVTLASVMLLASAGLTATVAQDSDAAFPFTTSGQWEGYLDLSGHTATDSLTQDGAFTVTINEVLGDPVIDVEFHVAADGTVSGTMPVSLRSSKESAGAASNGDPFHVLHDKQLTGILSLSGDAGHLVASGELQESSRTMADLELVEEVSGTESRNVEWVFAVATADCLQVTAPLVSAAGRTIAGSWMLPAETISGPSKINNSLTAQLMLWPRSEATSDAVTAAQDELTQLADDLHDRQIPMAQHLSDLADAWTDMQAETPHSTSAIRSMASKRRSSSGYGTWAEPEAR